MTDNELIVPLNCFINEDLDCSNCIYKDKKGTCQGFLYEDIFNLINRKNEVIDRQKDQIELLEIEKQALRGAANSYKKELQEKDRRLKGILPIVAQLKENTVKEFSKFLIDKADCGVIHISELPDFAIEFQEVGNDNG